MMAHAGHTIAAGLLEAYLGGDAGRRVHAGAVQRGSVESVRAVLWYADIRGFTSIADKTPGLMVIDLLDDVFEILTSSLRSRGGQVLKFMGDGMLATFPFVDATRDETCRRAIDAAVEAMHALDRLNGARCEAGKPAAAVDLALHVGEVLYGNVGAVDRLDFTVIGRQSTRSPARNLCEPLGRKVLVSASSPPRPATAARLEPLGCHRLRGVQEPRAIYGLDLPADRALSRPMDGSRPGAAMMRPRGVRGVGDHLLGECLRPLGADGVPGVIDETRWELGSAP
jgi:adenylate cyclase